MLLCWLMWVSLVLGGLLGCLWYIEAFRDKWLPLARVPLARLGPGRRRATTRDPFPPSRPRLLPAGTAPPGASGREPDTSGGFLAGGTAGPTRPRRRLGGLQPGAG